ncbi:hypothetical protein HHK36_010592 [Tetracentron sinense]|uniref:DUF641 domain-containing protein n=1 Tax=Tetracentron sinense TaxID=13715 RepID=A0A834Z9U1_TETSI|nr:hypothetical protein HHK36_010592 [Tetracentron sinense]
MESAIKSAKPSSNISDIVSRFAKACRFRSLGVLSGENPNHYQQHPNNAPSSEGSSNAFQETECEKIHPQPVVVVEEILMRSHQDRASSEIPMLLDTISALKLAYIQLQEAHIPYNPEKIQAADDLVVNELVALCKIKHAYKEKQITKHKSDSLLPNPLLLAEIQDCESLLKKLQSQIEAKDSEILQLQRELHELDQENAELEEKFKKKALKEGHVQRCRDLTRNSFYDTYKATSKSIHDFAKPLISLMKASGWDLDQVANSIEGSIIYSKRSHKKYAFEAYLSRRMFHGFSLQSYNVDDIMRFKDPFSALIENPYSNFAQFCRSKYLLVVHSKMEESFFGNLGQRAFVASGMHPRTPLYQAFVNMAKWVWVLQAIAASMKPKAEIFGVRRGSKFSKVYMENVVEDKCDTVVFDEEESKFRVGFMVMPGFRIGETLIRSRVYLSRTG